MKEAFQGVFQESKGALFWSAGITFSKGILCAGDRQYAILPGDSGSECLGRHGSGKRSGGFIFCRLLCRDFMVCQNGKAY